jgi:hypothetical protein
MTKIIKRDRFNPMRKPSILEVATLYFTDNSPNQKPFVPEFTYAKFDSNCFFDCRLLASQGTGTSGPVSGAKMHQYGQCLKRAQ